MSVSKKMISRAMDAISLGVEAVGGVLKSKRAYDDLLWQRSQAVRMLTSDRGRRLSPGLAGIVFSCDRPIQLHALLRSYRKLVSDRVPLRVIYRATEARYEQAYRQATGEFEDQGICALIPEESSFRETLIRELAATRESSVIFLTDDNLFIRRTGFELARRVDPFSQILSFRHGPHLRYSYTADVSQEPPAFISNPLDANLLEFVWFERGNEWSDPWSVDGHVLSTAEVLAISEVSRFKAPNTFEACLKSFNDLIVGRSGLCHSRSSLVNLPVNRVQSEVQNRSGSISVEHLLERWSDGFEIDIQAFENMVPRSTHEEHEIRFVRRGNGAP